MVVCNGIKEEGRKALVLYGSETGNAQDIADELGRMAQRLHFATDVTSFDTIEPSILAKYTIVLVALSTTGQGDLPNNARVFWNKLLRKKLPPTYMEHVHFTIFGLGDSSYPQYNWAGRKLYKRLIQLGAEELYPPGEGDQQHPEGYDSSFIPWLQNLRGHLLIQYLVEDGLEPIPDDCLLSPKWVLALSTQDELHLPKTNGRDTTKRDKKQDTIVDFDVILERNRRVTPANHWQDVRLLAFSTDEYWTYTPGDILTIYPQNASEDVNQILHLLNWSSIADHPVKFTSTSTHTDKDQNTHLPTTSPSTQIPSRPLTLRALLTTHLDLNAIPRRSFFALLAHFTTDPFQKARLQEFTQPEYIDELYDYTTRPRRSVLEVFQEFDSLNIPWQWATTVLPVLRGRQFSIASGGQLKHGPNTSHFELLVAIVRYKTVIKKIRQGVCTRYLAGLTPGTKLRVSLQKGDLGSKGLDLRRPVVMIGPGTGVAPMRSLVWERYQSVCRLAHAENVVPRENHAGGSSVLFFGARRRDADFFFADEWADLEEKLPLQVFTAFSRDQEEKVYVQDVIRQQGRLVYELLCEKDGLVYVCGSSGKMPAAVREALVHAFQHGGGMARAVAEAYLAEMEKEGRYKQETW